MIAGGASGVRESADRALSRGRASARELSAGGAAGSALPVPAVPAGARGPALARAPAQAPSRVGGAPPLPADGGHGASLPRSGHRAAGPQAAQVRLRRRGQVRRALTPILIFDPFTVAHSEDDVDTWRFLAQGRDRRRWRRPSPGSADARSHVAPPPLFSLAYPSLEYLWFTHRFLTKIG